MSEEVRFHVNSIFNSVSYRVGSILIDPGDIWDGFYGVTAVLLTHTHLDHIYGLNVLYEKNKNIKVFTNKDGEEGLLDIKKNLSLYHTDPFIFNYPESIVTVNNNDEILLDKGIFAKAVFTPGHNPSCICWAVENNIFTGDSYIPGIKTVTNLPGGDKKQAEESIKYIETIVYGKNIYSGHNIYM